MTPKRVYSRQQLMKIAEVVKDRRPTASEEEVYNIVEEMSSKHIAPSAALAHTAPNRRGVSKDPASTAIATSNHHYAPSSNNSNNNNAAAAASGRFAPDKRWGLDREPTATPTSMGAGNNDRRGAPVATGRGGGPVANGKPGTASAATAATSSSSWRTGGGKDRETFEEGYLYELKQSEKHKQVLDDAVAKYELSMKGRQQAPPAPPPPEKQQQQQQQKSKQGNKKAVEEESDSPAADDAQLTDELEAMFRKLKSQGDDGTEGGAVSSPTTVAEPAAKRSRFFSGADTADSSSSTGIAPPPPRHVEPKDMGLEMPPEQAAQVDPWAAWEQQQKQQEQQQKAQQQSSPQSSSTKIVHASDLEQHLIRNGVSIHAAAGGPVNLRALQQQIQPTAAAPNGDAAKATNGTVVMDAASLESALLAKGQQQGTGVPSPAAAAPQPPPSPPQAPQQQILHQAIAVPPGHPAAAQYRQVVPAGYTIQQAPYGYPQQQWVQAPAQFYHPHHAHAHHQQQMAMAQMQGRGGYMMIQTAQGPMQVAVQPGRPGQPQMQQVVYVQQHPGAPHQFPVQYAQRPPGPPQAPPPAR